MPLVLPVLVSRLSTAAAAAFGPSYGELDPELRAATKPEFGHFQTSLPQRQTGLEMSELRLGRRSQLGIELAVRRTESGRRGGGQPGDQNRQNERHGKGPSPEDDAPEQGSWGVQTERRRRRPNRSRKALITGLVDMRTIMHVSASVIEAMDRGS